MNETSKPEKPARPPKRRAAAKTAAPAKAQPARKPQAATTPKTPDTSAHSTPRKTPAQPAIADAPSYGVWPD